MFSMNSEQATMRGMRRCAGTARILRQVRRGADKIPRRIHSSVDSEHYDTLINRRRHTERSRESAARCRRAAGLKVACWSSSERSPLGDPLSASTKLIHGGLRYLEYFEFRLVAEALAERETLLSDRPAHRLGR